MNKVFNLEDARKARDEKGYSPAVLEIGDQLYKVLRLACHYGWDANTTMNNFLDNLGRELESGGCNGVADSLNGKRKHLLNAWTEILPQYIRYLRKTRFHLTTGRLDLIVEDGIQYQGDDPFPSPMLIVGFGTDPFDDQKVYASASLSARNIWFDGEVQNIDGPVVSNHPQTPHELGEKHIAEIPRVEWKDGVDSCKRGMFSPLVANELLKDFLLNGTVCNGGVKYKLVEKRHRFSYLETLSNSTVIEWSFAIHSEVYEVHGV